MYVKAQRGISFFCWSLFNPGHENSRRKLPLRLAFGLHREHAKRQVFFANIPRGGLTHIPHRVNNASTTPQRRQGGSMQQLLSTTHNKAIMALRKRLDRWELCHLRKLASEQDEQLQASKQRIEALERELLRAQESAEAWYESAMQLAAKLHEHGATVGLTQDGELVVAPLCGGAA